MQWRNAEHEPTEPVDQQYAVIRLDRADGTPLAVLFHYACHPVVLGRDNYQYSADFVGAACAAVEDALKTKCLFLQGACGNINPYMDKTPLDRGRRRRDAQDGPRRSASCLPRRLARPRPPRPSHPRLQFEARDRPDAGPLGSATTRKSARC